MLTRTARTDSAPALTVISIGSDIGFSDRGMGGTARGMACCFAGVVAAAGGVRTSALWSAGAVGAAGGLAAEFVVDIGSGQRVAAAGASMFALLTVEGGLLSAAGALAAGALGAGSARVSGSTATCENSARASETVRAFAGFLRDVGAASSATAAGSAALLAVFSASSFRNQQWRPVPRSVR